MTDQPDLLAVERFLIRDHGKSHAAQLQTLLNIFATWPYGAKAEVARDGFKGTVVGWYVTREGRPGLVIEQNGTLVVHVYGEGRVRGKP